jgi:hypothetical protein
MDSLQNTSWRHSGDHFSSVANDTIRSETYLYFFDDRLVIKLRQEDKIDSVHHDIKNLLQNESVFRIDIGRRKQKAYLYGYIQDSDDKLYIATSQIKTDATKSAMTKNLTDALWLDFERIK